MADVVKSLNKKAEPPFGIKGYQIAPTDVVTSRPRTTKFGYPFKIPGFVDKACKEKNFIPAADYNIPIDWVAQSKKSPRGAFLKKPRITFTSEVISEDKRRGFPGPDTYQQELLAHKKLNLHGSGTSEKRCEFIDDA